jgi:hypothetical protein
MAEPHASVIIVAGIGAIAAATLGPVVADNPGILIWSFIGALCALGTAPIMAFWPGAFFLLRCWAPGIALASVASWALAERVGRSEGFWFLPASFLLSMYWVTIWSVGRAWIRRIAGGYDPAKDGEK